jgi:hypothetical protein
MMLLSDYLLVIVTLTVMMALLHDDVSLTTTELRDDSITALPIDGRL